MESHVIFQIFEGKVEIHVNNEKHYLTKGQILASEPAIFSMKAIEASRLIGIQIKKQKK
jgi:quercetin dioxygenase-like cupin family protein